MLIVKQLNRGLKLDSAKNKLINGTEPKEANTTLHNTRPSVQSRTLKINDADRTLTHYFSTNEVNRYGYILSNEGMYEENYSKNPIVIFDHLLRYIVVKNPKDVIIGKSLRRDKDSAGIISLTKFYDTELATDCWNFNKDQMLNAWSLWWDFYKPIEESYQLLNDVPVITAWEPLEISSVIVPGNPGAVNQQLKLAKSMMFKQALSHTYLEAEYEILLNTQAEEIMNLTNKINSIVPSEEVNRVLFETSEALTDEELSKIYKRLLEADPKLKNGIEEIESLSNKFLNFKKSTVNQLSEIAGRLSNMENSVKNIPSLVSGVIRKWFGKVD